MNAPNSKFIVVKDTREKSGHGWSFDEDSLCAGTRIGTLKTGDYSIEGLEDTFCIERKETPAEFASNCVQQRWDNCVDRLAQMEHPYIIFEFFKEDIENWPKWAIDNARIDMLNKRIDAVRDARAYSKYLTSVRRRVYRTKKLSSTDVEITNSPRISPRLIWKKIRDAERAGIAVLFCDDSFKAEKKALEILREIYEIHVRRREL